MDQLVELVDGLFDGLGHLGSPSTSETEQPAIRMTKCHMDSSFSASDHDQSAEALEPSSDKPSSSNQPSHRRADSCTSAGNSICVISEDFTMIENEKQQLKQLRHTLSNLEIGKLGSNRSGLLPSSKSQESVSSTRSCELPKDSNKIEIQLSKSPEAKDLDRMIVFLENKKASGGGDVLSVSELDHSNNVLTVEFKSSRTKRALLRKGCLEFRGNKLFINEPIDRDMFTVDNASMILTNVSDEEDSQVVQMFAENLVIYEDSNNNCINTEHAFSSQDERQKDLACNSEDFNEVTEMIKSRVFAKTYIVKFKNEFDMKVARERLNRRPSLNGGRIELIDAYKTNIVLLRDSQFERLKSRIQSITDHLAELFRDAFFSVRLIEPFLLVKLSTQEQVAHLLKSEPVIDDRTYLTEQFVSYDLFMSQVKRFGEQVEPSVESSRQAAPVEPAESDSSVQNGSVHRPESPESTVEPVPATEGASSAPSGPREEETAISTDQPATKPDDPVLSANKGPQVALNNEQSDPNQEIKDCLADLRINQVRILYVYKYLKRVKDQLGSSVKIDINPAKRLVTFEGKRADVTKAKQIALDMITTVVTRDIQVSEPERMLFFVQKENAFVAWLLEKKIKCVVVPNPNVGTLSLSSLSHQEIDACISLMDREIISLQIDYDFITKRGQAFNDFIDGLRSESSTQFVVVDQIRSHNELRFAGFKEPTNRIHQQIVDKFVG